ncbi:hypothetical protein [Luteimonas salinilitoris]|uniref:Lytic transglycosylase domain-containing protein n=1 Tax=Luteimonas salinilitoris TaxID=3237697 RepID=A0ABV4HN86_9GAMM
MHTIRHATLAVALAIGLGLPAASNAQTVGYNVRTGDVWVDNRLGEINDYGRRYRDPFVNEMTGYYGAPRPLVVELLDERRWAPGDVYYACAIAHALGMPCMDVVREYDRDPGQGWGAVAKRMGIKPGSPAFHALKRGTASTYDRWGYPVVVDRPVRVDWSKHGPDKRARTAGRSDAHPAPHTNSRRADRPGQDKGKGKGKNKGKDKDD